MDDLKFALFLAIGLAPSLLLHEWAHAFAADRLGDPTPRRWGRLGLNPRPLIDPFGTLILPGLVLVLVASGNFCLLPIFAYGKPTPSDPYHLRNPKRSSTIVTLAGLGVNLVLAIVAGLVLRAGVGASSDLATFVYAVFLVNVYMFVFQLMPIPGLDGAKLLAPVLPPRAREVYTNLDQYLVLFILVVFFLLSGPFLAIVRALAEAITRLIVGVDVIFC